MAGTPRGDEAAGAAPGPSGRACSSGGASADGPETPPTPHAAARVPTWPPTARRGRPATGVREALLAATEAELAESGAALLSTKAVARRAGVAESSVYYHFGDRVGLLLSAVWEYLQPVVELFYDGRRERGDSLRENLTSLFDTLEAFFLRTVPVIAAIQSDARLREAFVERSRHLGVGPHRAIEGTTAFLAAEQQAGRVRKDADLRACAMLLVSGAYQRAVQLRLGAPDAVRWLASSGEAVDALLPALEP